VAEEETHLGRRGPERLEHVGIHDDELAAGEARGEGVEQAAGLEDVERGEFAQFEARADVLER
jgi:hypothetical protein